MPPPRRNRVTKEMTDTTPKASGKGRAQKAADPAKDMDGILKQAGVGRDHRIVRDSSGKISVLDPLGKVVWANGEKVRDPFSRTADPQVTRDTHGPGQRVAPARPSDTGTVRGGSIPSRPVPEQPDAGSVRGSVGPSRQSQDVMGNALHTSKQLLKSGIPFATNGPWGPMGAQADARRETQEQAQNTFDKHYWAGMGANTGAYAWDDEARKRVSTHKQPMYYNYGTEDNPVLGPQAIYPPAGPGVVTSNVVSNPDARAWQDQQEKAFQEYNRKRKRNKGSRR